MTNAVAMNVGLRALTVDELDEVSGGKGKKATGVRIENCTTTIYPGGKEVQKCTVVSETLN
jgi:hypothetical protein